MEIMQMDNKHSERSDLLFLAMKITHEKRDYANAPGIIKLGLINPVPLTDHKNKEFLIRAEEVIKRDADGNPIETVSVIVSRDEALILMDYLPSQAEIEARKRECEFLFPPSHRDRIARATPDPLTIPFVTQADSNAPNRYGSADY